MPRRPVGRPTRRRVVLAAGATAVAALVASGTAVAVPERAPLPPGCTQDGRAVSCVFGFTGAAETFTPPVGIGFLTVTASAGGGGAGGTAGVASVPGGGGAVVAGDLTVLPGVPLSVLVGGGGSDAASGPRAFGYGRGGSGGRDTRPQERGGSDGGGGGGGGGASAVVGALGPLLVAGAGGGGGAGSRQAGVGGASGADGMTAPMEPLGNGGHAGAEPGPDGGDGDDFPDPRLGFSVGIGGAGGGGGGGGLRGGDGGDEGGQYRGGGAGGGGGTSLVPAGGTVADGVRTGDGEVVISYTAPGAEEPQPPAGGSGPDGDHAGDQGQADQDGAWSSGGGPGGNDQSDDQDSSDDQTSGEGDPSPTGTPPPTSTPELTPAQHQCTVTASSDGGRGGRGVIDNILTFVNRGSNSCVVDGFPDVRFLAADGTTVGEPARPDRNGIGRVALAPGGKAVARLLTVRTDEIPEADCNPVPVRGLLVTPPADAAPSETVSSVDTACTTRAQLSVDSLTPSS